MTFVLEIDVPAPPKRAHGDAFDPCSHVANGHRIREHFGDRLLFVEGIGWHVWAPPWRLDELAAQRIAMGLGQIIAKEAAERAAVCGADDPEAKRLFAWAGQSERAQHLRASLAMAAPLLSVRAEQLDADPFLLGCPSGVLELQTATFREHRQSDLVTKVTGADFDPEARAPLWERFIHEAMAGDAELIDYVQRLCGYLLSGLRGEHLLPIFHGGGGNGKSVALGTLQSLLGDYAGTAAPGLLMQQHGSEHPTALADLQGKRLVVASETGEGGRLAEDQVKALTGGDRISARRMRMDFYTFAPTHQIILQTNHRPKVNGTDEGIWRRLRLVPWLVTVPPEKRDPYLPGKLRRELPGILAWCYEGFSRQWAQGFNSPAAVSAATAAYREASDVVGQFLSECCDLDPHATETAKALYAAYAQWTEDSGERQLSQAELGKRLEDRGLERHRSNGVRRWRGVRVLDSAGSAGSAATLGMNRLTRPHER
jgi:putative DNA primase/helicase